MDTEKILEIIEKMQEQININNERITLLNEKIDLVHGMVILHNKKGEVECENSQRVSL